MKEKFEASKVILKNFFRKYTLGGIGFFLISKFLDVLFNNVVSELIKNLVPRSKIPVVQFIGNILSLVNFKVPIYSIILSFLIVITLYRFWYYLVNKGKLVILDAKYGSGNSFYDVTDKLRQSIQNNKLKIVLSNAIAGDPTPGTVKVGKIKFKLGSRTLYREFVENNTIDLP